MAGNYGEWRGMAGNFPNFPNFPNLGRLQFQNYNRIRFTENKFFSLRNLYVIATSCTLLAKDILTEYYTSKEIQQLKKKLKPQDLQDDIIQHCFCELYQKPDTFIIDLYNRRKLRVYIVKMIIHTSYYQRTPFAKQFGENEICTDSFGEHHEAAEDNTLDDFTKLVDDLYWYKKEILKLYAEKGTYQAVSDDTGIPVTSIYNTIKEVKREIKKKLWKQ